MPSSLPAKRPSIRNCAASPSLQVQSGASSPAPAMLPKPWESSAACRSVKPAGYVPGLVVLPSRLRDLLPVFPANVRHHPPLYPPRWRSTPSMRLSQTLRECGGFSTAPMSRLPPPSRREISRELAISVSIGLSLSKVLAKLASKYRKPRGRTIIPGRAIAAYLQDVPIGKIWGIGPATTNYLNKLGIRTALEFARLPETAVRKRLTKPGVEIWQELRGESVLPVTDEAKSSYASISKTKTFAPPTNNPDYLFAQLLRNLESACIKARRYRLAAGRIVSFLKTQSFETAALRSQAESSVKLSPGIDRHPEKSIRRPPPCQ